MTKVCLVYDDGTLIAPQRRTEWRTVTHAHQWSESQAVLGECGLHGIWYAPEAEPYRPKTAVVHFLGEGRSVVSPYAARVERAILQEIVLHQDGNDLFAAVRARYPEVPVRVAPPLRPGQRRMMMDQYGKIIEYRVLPGKRLVMHGRVMHPDGEMMPYQNGVPNGIRRTRDEWCLIQRGRHVVHTLNRFVHYLHACGTEIEVSYSRILYRHGHRGIVAVFDWWSQWSYARELIFLRRSPALFGTAELRHGFQIEWKNCNIEYYDRGIIYWRLEASDSFRNSRGRFRVERDTQKVLIWRNGQKHGLHLYHHCPHEWCLEKWQRGDLRMRLVASAGIGSYSIQSLFRGQPHGIQIGCDGVVEMYRHGKLHGLRSVPGVAVEMYRYGRLHGRRWLADGTVEKYCDGTRVS